MRVIFLGTPSFAVLPLEALLRDARYTVVGVVTQPDRPAGRNQMPQPTPVKQAAQQFGIPVLQPETLRDPEAVAQLVAWQPEVGVVAAYGEILRKNVLAIPPLGYINIHPSLLPLHRGPGPVTGAILAGEAETGVSLIKLESKMDAGPILAQQRMPLPPDARAGQLTDDLFQIGSQMLVETLAPYAAGDITLVPQDDAQATYTRLLSKADGVIDWSSQALQIERMTRAYDPWPGATTTYRDQPLKIIAAAAIEWVGDEPPGTILDDRDDVVVSTGAGGLRLLTVQPSGKRPMPADAWRRGLRETRPRLGN